MTITLSDEAATRELGRRLAVLLPDGAVVALDGPLGAGKTRLVQGVAVACGVPIEDIVSPTFSLIHEYRGRRPVYHFDAYRLRDDDEFLALGPDEYFFGSGISVVEWAEKVSACLPPEYLSIRLTPVDAQTRHAAITPHGEIYADVVRRLSSPETD